MATKRRSRSRSSRRSRTGSARRRFGSAAPTISWQGTDYIEKRLHSVRNALVAVYLNGVRGISDGDVPWARSQVSKDEADRIIGKASDVLAWMKSQKRAPTAHTRHWMQHHTADLGRLLSQVEAVRAGSAPKTTRKSHNEYLQSLGIAPR